MSRFFFRRFSISNDAAAMKVGTDSVLLGALATIPQGCHRVLDIGTGTGAVALLIAQRLEESGLTAVSIDTPSAEEAAQNFKDSPWSAQMHAISCPLQKFEAREKFDLIVSNPPYFDNSLVNPDERQTTARHTQSLSFRDICAFCSEHLAGRLSLILPAEVERELVRTAASFGLRLSRIVRIRTTQRKPVKRIVAEFVKEDSAARTATEESLLIHLPGGDFSPEYREKVLRFLPEKQL